VRLGFHIALISALLLFAAPLYPCRGGCRFEYESWMRAASTPWATPQQSAAVYAWAKEHGCRVCANTDRVSAGRMWGLLAVDQLRHLRDTGHIHFW
jgi:hypothetical protein